MIGRELTRRRSKSYTQTRAELTGNRFWTLRGSFSGLSHVGVIRTSDSDKTILPKTPQSVEFLGAWSSDLKGQKSSRQFFRLNRVAAAGSDAISRGLKARDIIARGEAQVKPRVNVQTNLFALKGRDMAARVFVSVFQALGILCDGLPGPTLVGLTSTQAVI